MFFLLQAICIYSNAMKMKVQIQTYIPVLRVANALRDVRLMHVDVSDEAICSEGCQCNDVPISPMKECTVVRG